MDSSVKGRCRDAEEKDALSTSVNQSSEDFLHLTRTAQNKLTPDTEMPLGAFWGLRNEDKGWLVAAGGHLWADNSVCLAHHRRGGPLDPRGSGQSHPPPRPS